MPGLVPCDAAITLMPSRCTRFASVRKYQGVFADHSKNPPMSSRLYELSNVFHVPVFNRGNVVVSRAVPTPLYGVRAPSPEPNACRTVLPYSRYLNRP